MEADFQREYGIDLERKLPVLSWRRFQALVKGLGPNSAYGLMCHDKDGGNTPGPAGAGVIDGDADEGGDAAALALARFVKVAKQAS